MDQAFLPSCAVHFGPCERASVRITPHPFMTSTLIVSRLSFKSMCESCLAPESGRVSAAAPTN